MAGWTLAIILAMFSLSAKCLVLSWIWIVGHMSIAILYDQFEKALSELKSAKATGIDGVPALKALWRTG